MKRFNKLSSCASLKIQPAPTDIKSTPRGAANTARSNNDEEEDEEMSMIWRDFRKLAIERAARWDEWSNRERQEHMEKMRNAREKAMLDERDRADLMRAEVNA
jgi:hypothetical protein